MRLCWCVLALLPLVLHGCAGSGIGVIHETPSMFGTLVVTDDGGGLRSLRFGRGGITQSTIRVGDPDHLQFGYARLAVAGLALACVAAPPALLPDCPAPRRILVVGLGGGSLPVFLHRHFPESLIDVVDIDPAVITAAKQYFGFAEDARMRAHAGDGRAFIERAPAGHYDIILLDAFGSAEVPGHLTTAEFLRAVRRALAADGVVVSNVWSRSYNRLYDRILRTYSEEFAQLHVLASAREVNHLVFALPQARAVSDAQFVAAAQRMGRARRLRFDLGALVTQSILSAPFAEASAPVLRDAAR